MSWLLRPGIASLLPALALAALFACMPPDGQERSPWLLFAGKFHLLTIHFPIALLYLVPILEFAGRYAKLPHLRASAEFVLVLGMLSSLFAATFGWALARSGGYSGPLVTQHMWGGLLTAAACWLCWFLRARMITGRDTALYAVALSLTVGIVSWTGYRGGQLTQGENHLTDGMPAPLRNLIGISPTAAPKAKSTAAPSIDRTTFYGARVEPILSANCYSCHGAQKQRGQLRLDSYTALMRGGKSGPAIKAGDAPTSLLVHRISLPQSNDDAMPPQGKRPLTPDEIQTIRAWINAGASETMPLPAAQGAPTAPPSAEVTLPEYDPAPTEALRAAHAADVQTLKTRYPNLLEYESRTSAQLTLNAQLAATKFTDQDLAAFKPVLVDISSADFSGTSITDNAAPLIAAMKHLRQLRLAHTKIGDTMLRQLQALPELQSINLLGTGITPAAMPALAAMPSLRHIYIADTLVTPITEAPPALKQKLVF